MFQRIRTFLSRPISEDFSLRYQARLSMMATIYIYIFLTVFVGATDPRYPRWFFLAHFAGAAGVSSWLVNVVLPHLFPTYYDEDRYTVARHAGHILLVLLAVASGNQLVLWLHGLPRLPFWRMYLIVMAVGFFPVGIGVMIAEQRRLKRNLTQAQQLNVQLDRLHESAKVVAPDLEPTLPKGILLTGEGGKDRLSLLPNQLVYIESVGNYVEVYWLNFMFPQKTVLRLTLKDAEAALVDHPQFFRCHRAFLVNLRAVSHTTGNSRGYQLTMSGSQREIPVSRTYVSAFDERMNKISGKLLSHGPSTGSG